MYLRNFFLVSPDFLNKNEKQSLPKKKKKRINKMKHVKKKSKKQHQYDKWIKVRNRIKVLVSCMLCGVRLHITVANYIQNFVQHPAVKVNSICGRSYWGSSMWIPTQ
jgi:hypothetical protein